MRNYIPYNELKVGDRYKHTSKLHDSIDVVMTEIIYVHDVMHITANIDPILPAEEFPKLDEGTDKRFMYIFEKYDGDRSLPSKFYTE